ncbi:MAG: energy-coupling factor transporter transmembrane protein EcfT [Peptococcaceae bacterium]|nr:energy-coupling factor transporter transmembrane protein EcfT [Peptococcaceae bacterium]
MDAGLYLPGESILHKLDSRLKTGSLVAVSFLTTMAHGLGLFSLSVGILVLFFLSGLSFRRIRSLFLAVAILGLFYAVALGWYWDESWHFWRGYWSTEGLIQAGIIMLRIGIIFILTRLYMAVTSPSDQGLGIAYFFTPLTRITPKAADFSLLITLTLRFLPLLIEEAGMLYKARLAKGNIPQNTGKRIIELANLLLPLLSITLRRAEELADNLLTRGYVSGGYRVLGIKEWEKRDSIGTAVLLVWLAITILIQNVGVYSY